MILKLVSINTAFVLLSQLAPDWLRVMSNMAIANCQKSDGNSIQLEGDSDDKNDHMLNQKHSMFISGYHFGNDFS